MLEGAYGTFMTSRLKLQYSYGLELKILNRIRGSNQHSFSMQNECIVRKGAVYRGVQGAECRRFREQGVRGAGACIFTDLVSVHGFLDFFVSSFCQYLLNHSIFSSV